MDINVYLLFMFFTWGIYKDISVGIKVLLCQKNKKGQKKKTS